MMMGIEKEKKRQTWKLRKGYALKDKADEDEDDCCVVVGIKKSFRVLSYAVRDKGFCSKKRQE